MKSWARGEAANVCWPALYMTAQARTIRLAGRVSPVRAHVIRSESRECWGLDRAVLQELDALVALAEHPAAEEDLDRLIQWLEDTAAEMVWESCAHG